jgi:hypothetical protein
MASAPRDAAFFNRGRFPVDTMRVGANYRFGNLWPDPVVAKY